LNSPIRHAGACCRLEKKSELPVTGKETYARLFLSILNGATGSKKWLKNGVLWNSCISSMYQDIVALGNIMVMI
jgi:hypothetical protein